MDRWIILDLAGLRRKMRIEKGLQKIRLAVGTDATYTWRVGEDTTEETHLKVLEFEYKGKDILCPGHRGRLELFEFTRFI